MIIVGAEKNQIQSSSVHLLVHFHLNWWLDFLPSSQTAEFPSIWLACFWDAEENQCKHKVSMQTLHVAGDWFFCSCWEAALMPPLAWNIKENLARKSATTRWFQRSCVGMCPSYKGLHSTARMHLLAPFHRSKYGDPPVSITVSWWCCCLVLIVTTDGSIGYTPISLFVQFFWNLAVVMMQSVMLVCSC